MITSIEIMTRLQQLLAESYPDHSIYMEQYPEPSARPCFMLELVTADRFPVSCKTVQETVYLTITCFAVAEDDPASGSNPFVTQQGVLELFRTGYLAVADRKISVQASPGGRNEDQAYVDLQFEYFEDRSAGQDTAPLMKEVHTTF